MKVTREEYETRLSWQPVESTHIARVAWQKTDTDATTGAPIGQVAVEFGSSPRRAYVYGNVPEALYRDLLSAGSAGGFFARNIRGRFEHERVEVEPDEE